MIRKQLIQLKNGPIILTDTSLKDAYRWQKYYKNMLLITGHKINEIQTTNITIHLLEWLKSDNSKCQQGYRAIDPLIHCWWQSKITPATLEDSLMIPYKTIKNLAINPVIMIIQRVENICAHKNLHVDIYRSFIHNYQNSEATKISSIGECVNKL